jgi:hypothetical protein
MLKTAVFWIVAHVVLQKFTNVSEVLAATIIRAICPGDGGSKHF